MKKIILSGLLTLSLFASDKMLSKTQINNVLKSTPIYNQLAPQLKTGKIKIKATKKDGFYIMELDTSRGKGLLYVTADKKFTILGRVLKRNGQMLIPNFPKNAQIIKNGVMFTFGKGNKNIYLVTDPECPFCRMMEKEKRNLLSKDYKIHVILMPLPFHKYAKPMSYYILAAKTDKERAKRLQETLLGGNEWKNFHPTKAQIKKFNEELAKSKKAADELGAQGTPSVYDKNFNPISWPRLGDKK